MAACQSGQLLPDSTIYDRFIKAMRLMSLVTFVSLLEGSF